MQGCNIRFNEDKLLTPESDIMTWIKKYNNRKEVSKTEKIVQTAGRNALGKFAPEFAHYNDDILFGENWNKKASIRKKGTIPSALFLER